MDPVDSPGERSLAAVAFRLAQGIGVVLAAFVFAVVVASAGAGALVSAGLVRPETVPYQVAVTVFQFVGFSVAIAGYLLVADDGELIGYGVPTRFGWGLVAVGVVGLLAAQFGLSYLLTQLGIQVGENQVILLGREDPRFFLYMIAVSILLVGPIEELLFRGVVQGLLRRALSAWPAILLASGLFGLVHVWAVQGATGQQLVYAVVAAALGLVLGYLYERTGNVVVPGIAHGVYNAVLFAIQYVVATQGIV